MGLPISRREFVLATSSFASFTMVEPIRSIARTGRGGSIAPSFVDSTLQAQDAGLKMKPKVLVFDVNQTMLDLNALRPQFARVFGDGKALDEWFSLLLHYSLGRPRNAREHEGSKSILRGRDANITGRPYDACTPRRA